MSQGVRIAQIRKALDFGTILDFVAKRKCELCDHWNDPPNVHVPGNGWYCIGCELTIQLAQKSTRDAAIVALAGKYNRRRAVLTSPETSGEAEA